ncbi:hypothetical protein PEB0150_015120 [Bartonella apis]|nr:hypothetical protein PEB0150_015120 [Bartonella apis]
MPIISVLKTVISKSLTQELTKTILTEQEGISRYPTLLADMVITVIGKMAMILAFPKEGKAKTPDAEKRILIRC